MMGKEYFLTTVLHLWVEFANDKRLKLLEYYQKDNNASPMKLDILKKYCSYRLPLPYEKQSKILYELYNNAISEGVHF